MNPSSSRHSSLERSRLKNGGVGGSTEDVYRQRLDDAYYLRRMRDILMDGCCSSSQARPVFPCRMTRLCDCLYMGNQRNAEDIEQLVSHGITHVINCAPSKRRASCAGGESPYPVESGIVGFRVIAAEDKEDYEIIGHFDETVRYLQGVSRIKGRALVHCNMGVNRSGAIAAAYLIAGERRRLLETIAYLKEKRGVVLTNKGFRRQLIRYARQKRLLDPISSDYYVRRSGDFDRFPPALEQQLAFSTPQLRRCAAPEQKPPRSRHRNGRCRTSNPANGSRLEDEFSVKSLPRNIAAGGTGPQRRRAEEAAAVPMTRRSISYIVKEPDPAEAEEESLLRRRTTRARSHHSSFRKSIAVDHILPQCPMEADGLPAAEPKDDIPRLRVGGGGGGGGGGKHLFSTRCNLTIARPKDENAKHRNHSTADFRRDQGQGIFFHRPPEKGVDEEPTKRPEGGREATAGGRGGGGYCKQIRQHFSGLIDLIRPSAFKSVTSTQTSTPRSNQLSFALPLVRSEPKPIRIVGVQSDDRHGSHGGGGVFYVSTNRISVSAPGPRSRDATVGRECPAEVPPCRRHFSTKINHVVRRFDGEPGEAPAESTRPQIGSLVHIGTRTLQPRSPQSCYGDESKPDASDRSTSAAGRSAR